MANSKGLIYPDGRPVRAIEIAGIRARASLTPDIAGGPNPWAYDGAMPVSQDMANWFPQIRSPDAEINENRDLMVARARDLVRNDGWASGAINRLLDAMIGSNFFPIPMPNHQALARRFGPAFDKQWAREFQSVAISEFKVWAGDPGECDSTGQQTFAQQMHTLARAKLTEGDNLGMLDWDQDRVEAGLSNYATCILGIDTDRLSNPLNNIDSADRRGGVQIDGRGKPLGYHIREAHQYDPYNTVKSITWVYYPRFTRWGRPVIVHDFDRDRWNEHRGVGILHSVLARFRMLSRFDQTSLQANVIRAVLGFFMTSARDPDTAQDALEASGGSANDEFYQGLATALLDQQPVRVGGVRVPILPPGEKVQTVAGGGQATDHKVFAGSMLRGISSATLQADPEVSNDFSEMNYSSFRGAQAQAWKSLIRRRDSFAAGTARPYYGAWLEEMTERFFAEIMPASAPRDVFQQARGLFTAARWIGPGKGWTDPVKERQGEVLGLDAAFGTLEDTCADIEGAWWEDRLDQREIETQAFKDRGLKLPAVFMGGENAQQSDEKPQPA